MVGHALDAPVACPPLVRTVAVRPATGGHALVGITALVTSSTSAVAAMLLGPRHARAGKTY